MLLRCLSALSLVLSVLGCAPKIGNKCTISTDCSQLGDRLCDTTQPEGYCTIFNCEPDTCPDSVCVAFDYTLDPACGEDDGRWPRFERSFCMSPCDSIGDCRDQYECVDLSVESNKRIRRATVVDLVGLAPRVCMAATCYDNIEDGLETDVDCGGPTCKSCGSGFRCELDTDCCRAPGSTCTSNAACCSGTCNEKGYCAAMPDGSVGGAGVCKGKGKACTADADCSSRVCAEGTCQGGVCDGSCANGTRDNDETDVDCGGPTCPRCFTGKTCNVDADCAANQPCLDDKCPTGKSCKVDSDCIVDQACNDSKCAPAATPDICKPYPGYDGGIPWTPYTPDGGAGP